MTAPKLPSPRRLIMGHKADGSPVVHDETVPTVQLGTFEVAQAFMQHSFDPDPIEAFSGKDKAVDGMVNTKGAVVRWVGRSSISSPIAHPTGQFPSSTRWIPSVIAFLS